MNLKRHGLALHLQREGEGTGARKVSNGPGVLLDARRRTKLRVEKEDRTGLQVFGIEALLMLAPEC
jgi:hypothetical protein